MRPGFQTTEFWLSALAQMLSLAVLLGLLTVNESKALEEALGKCVAAVCTILVNAQVVIHYIKSRTTLKVNGNGHGPNGSKNGGPILPALLPWIVLSGAALLFAGPWIGAAQAEPLLPWRHQINQRLNHQEQLLRDLIAHQRQAPAPPQQLQPQPPILLLPQPYQMLPIPGEPKQLLPIPGDPKQQLPIPGEPRQPLPPQGEPKQELPIPGPPLQPLPPSPTQPQRYSLRALWRTL